MVDDHASEQPLQQVLSTGTLAILLVLAIATLCIAPFEHRFFVDWVATAFIAATPAQVVLGLLWNNNKPDCISGLSQPAKGLSLLAITLAVGALVFTLLILLMSGGYGMTPMFVQFTIMTVVAILWVLLIWQCWPLTKLSEDPFKFGSLAFLFSYVLAYLLWTIFFDYSLLGTVGHPLYHSDIDPQGLFNMWSAMTFCITTVGVIVVHTLFDFWPVDKLAGQATQPLRGFIATGYILVLSWLIRAIFVDGLGMAPVEYLVRVPVCLIFGSFIVSNMMQFSLFPKFAQPIRGLVLLVCAALTAVVMYELYSHASTLHAGTVLGMGPDNDFAKELWIASAMLGVTFPIIFVVSGFFAFWPLKRS